MPATTQFTTLGLVAAVLALLGAPEAEAGNQRPIIGIMAQPKDTDFCTGDKCQYIAASYVKFVESHGGRAMPISYYSTDEEVEEIMQHVNGVLIPGGGSAVPDVMYKIYSKAKEMNEAGDYFPLWGTCMGFEWLVMVAGGDLDSGFDSENVSLPLTFTDDARDSRLWGGLSSDLYEEMQGSNTSAFNNHKAGITPDDFMASKDLTADFKILSTSNDRMGRPFVSSMEGNKYPFYGVQFHPEKIIWELGESPSGTPYEQIPHNMDAVETTLYLAKFLNTEARQSTHKFDDPAEEEASLIWQYPVFYTAPEFVQSYIYEF